jgi:hypothetical protein
MTRPIFKKTSDPVVDNTVPPAKYGAPDVKYAFDVLDGSHLTDRVQINNGNR